MAVDTSFGTVSLLVQGGTSTNVGSFNGNGSYSLAVTPTGTTAESDHLAFSETDSLLVADPTKATGTQYGGGNVALDTTSMEMVVEHAWAPTANLFRTATLQARGHLEIPNRYELFARFPYWNSSYSAKITEFDLPASGKVLVRVMTGAVDSVQVVPETGAAVTINHGSYSTFSYPLLVGDTSEPTVVAPSVAVASVSNVVDVTGSSGASTPSVLVISAPSYNRVAGSPQTPSSGSASMSAVGATATLPNIAGMTSSSVVTTLAAQLAAAINLGTTWQASAGATAYGGAELRLTPLTSNVSGGTGVTVSGMAYFDASGVYPSASVNLSGGAVVQQSPFYSPPPAVAQVQSAYITVNDPTKALKLNWVFGATTQAFDLQNNVAGAVSAATAAAAASGITATATQITPTQWRIQLNFPNAGAVSGVGFTITESVASQSAVTKLYGLRVTGYTDRSDTIFPTLPWPTTSILPSTGVGVQVTTDVPFYFPIDSEAPGAELVNLGYATTDHTIPAAAANRPITATAPGGGLAIQLNGSSDPGNTVVGLTPVAVTIGAGDYTTELYVYINTFNANMSILAMDGNDTGGRGILQTFSDNRLGWSAVSSFIETGADSIVANTWYHVAYSRQSGTGRLFLNGVLKGSSTDTEPVFNSAKVGPVIGFLASNGFGGTIDGFVDDVIVTLRAKYAADFTPAARGSAFPPQINADVTGAGYNDVAALTSTGSGSQQANFPDSYGSGSTTLDSFTVTTVAYIDAADLTGTGSSTLGNFTCAADGVAADPTNMDGSSALDDFTCAADGVASTPTEFAVNYVLGDFTSLAVGLFLAPSEGSGASSIDAITCMATCTITEPETLRGTFTMPSPQFTATSTRTVFRGFVGSAPFMSATAQSGHRSVVTSPAMKASATATTVQMARAIMTMPMVDVFSTGRVSGTAAMFARMPSADSTAIGGHQAVMESPSMTATATGIHGGVAQVAARMPWVVTLISGYREDTGRVIASMPMLVPTPSATASVQPPMFTATARGHAVLANAYEAYVLNMSQQIASDQQAGAGIAQMTRYTNWPFVQVVRLGDIYYGLAEDGLYELVGPTDNGTEIAWSFETCKTDFGDPHKKAVVSAYVGGQAGPVVDYTLRSGDDPDYMYEYVTNKVTQKRNHRQKFGLGRRVRYYSFGLAGTGKLAIDEIEFELMNTTRRI